MGNSCTAQFENISQDEEYVEEMERIETTMIKQEHKSLKPVQSLRLTENVMPSEKEFRSIHGLDNEAMHNTFFVKENQYIQPSQIQKIPDYDPLQNVEKLEELDLEFYHTLGLEEYAFKPYPPEEYQGVQTTEQQDKYGIKYIGEWKNGDLHGNGVLLSNTSKYIGQFKNGLKHYSGREIFKSQVYEGEFQLGKRKGFGTRYTSSETEVGVFDGDLIQGKILYANHNIYEGLLLNKKYHGSNSYLYIADTQIHYKRATFQKGNLQYAFIQYPNQNTYEGEIMKGCKHGKGIFKWKNGDWYEGSYHYDFKHGLGNLYLQHKNKLYPNKHFHHGNLVENYSEFASEIDNSQTELPQNWRSNSTLSLDILDGMHEQ